jgi:uncharacterized protein DUF3309
VRTACCGTIFAKLLFETNHRGFEKEEKPMGLILLVLLIILLLGAVPAWGYSRNWGYGPSGGIGLILLIVVILLLLRVF